MASYYFAPPPPLIPGDLYLSDLVTDRQQTYNETQTFYTLDATSSTSASVVLYGGLSVQKSLLVGSTTVSISPSTGSLIVSGGVGIYGNLNIGESLNVDGTINGPTNILGQLTIDTTTQTAPSHINIYGDATSQISLGNGGIVLNNGVVSANQGDFRDLYSTNNTSLASVGPLGFFGNPSVNQQMFITPTPIDLSSTIARVIEISQILNNYGLTSNF